MADDVDVDILSRLFRPRLEDQKEVRTEVNLILVCKEVKTFLTLSLVCCVVILPSGDYKLVNWDTTILFQNT